MTLFSGKENNKRDCLYNSDLLLTSIFPQDILSQCNYCMMEHFDRAVCVSVKAAILSGTHKNIKTGDRELKVRQSRLSEENRTNPSNKQKH